MDGKSDSFTAWCMKTSEVFTNFVFSMIIIVKHTSMSIHQQIFIVLKI